MLDYDYLRQMSKGIPAVIRYGTDGADIEGLVEKREPYLTVKMRKGLQGIVKTGLVGDYNLPNILAAVAIGKHFGVADEKIIPAIENYVPSNSRSQLIEKGTNKIILDAYNANPSSMTLAIENFAKTNPEKKVLLLGGMAELGSGSLQEHEEIIALIKKYPWKAVALVGGDFCKLKHPYHSFENAGEAKRWLKEKKFEHTDFLLKGSRSIQMEKVLEP
jgi:UDP-N-acetylmuramoyl-tripeptide--D-alanyl-D-alanine ligase